jgi:hypothetical protein
MFRLNARLILIIILLFIGIFFLSGCYTIVGYPADVREGITEKHDGESYKYDYEYYESPYYLDYGYYYLPYPYYYDRYSYWYRPWYYDGGYYWDDDYHYNYTPEKKPEIRKRSVMESPRTDNSVNRQKEPVIDSSNEKQSSSDDNERSNRRHK